MTAALSLMKDGLTPLANNISLSFGLSVGNSALDVTTQKKNYGWETTALIISNEEREDIMKIVKSYKESGLLMKRISEAIKNEAREQREDFF